MVNVQALPQEGETAVHLERGRAFSYRVAYARAADTAAAEEPGQDYLTFAELDRAFVFALCDGVSQSFYGNIAARLLGDTLCAWLAGTVPAVMTPEPVAAALAAELAALTEPGSAAVAGHPLPPAIPLMLREVLEQKRAHGSESTFVCGRLDQPSAAFPQGRVLLAWMGDSRLRLWGHESAPLDGLAADRFRTMQRWSTRRGLDGELPHVHITPLAGHGGKITALAAYSDGLSAADALPRLPANPAVQELIEQAGLQPASDDISFIEVWPGPPPAGISGAPPLPAPARLAAAVSEEGVRLTWMRVRGADGYEVKARQHGRVRQWQAQATFSEWRPPGGSVQVQVRARRGDEPGRWSAPLMVEAPFPPAPPEPPPASAPPTGDLPPAPLPWQAAGAPGPPAPGGEPPARAGRDRRLPALLAGSVALVAVGGMVLAQSRCDSGPGIPFTTATPPATAAPSPAPSLSAPAVSSPSLAATATRPPASPVPSATPALSPTAGTSPIPATTVWLSGFAKQIVAWLRFWER